MAMHLTAIGHLITSGNNGLPNLVAPQSSAKADPPSTLGEIGALVFARVKARLRRPRSGEPAGLGLDASEHQSKLAAMDLRRGLADRGQRRRTYPIPDLRALRALRPG